MAKEERYESTKKQGLAKKSLLLSETMSSLLFPPSQPTKESPPPFGCSINGFMDFTAELQEAFSLFDKDGDGVLLSILSALCLSSLMRFSDFDRSFFFFF